jgi:hypothetical protein
MNMAESNIILTRQEIATEKFSLPPFEVKSGEIVIINLQPAKDLYETEMRLVHLLTGKTRCDEINIFQPITFVEHYRQPRWRQLFFPVMVSEYLRKKANSGSPFANKIYELTHISKRTQVDRLSFKDRRLLCLYTALSNTQNIVMDFVGLSGNTINKFFKIVQEVAKKGGSVVVLDYGIDKKKDCSKYIELEWKD